MNDYFQEGNNSNNPTSTTSSSSSASRPLRRSTIDGETGSSSAISGKFRTTNTSNNSILHSEAVLQARFLSDRRGSGFQDGKVNEKREGCCSGGVISGRYNNILVPRGEFCRRVLWLYNAESGLLLLYYAEDIAGEQYARKNLRYSICFVCEVSDTMNTIDEHFIRHFIQPYSSVLTVVAEELRDAEERYGYMSQGLQSGEESDRERTRMEENGGKTHPSGGGGGDEFSSSAPHRKHLNYFVTPTEDPKWISLDRFFNALYNYLVCPTSANRNVNKPFRLHLSDTISFYVKLMAPLQPLTYLNLDAVPVSITTEEMQTSIFPMEEEEDERRHTSSSSLASHIDPNRSSTYVTDSMDVVIQAILKLIDNKKHRTVADICFALAFHTTVTLEEVYQAAAEYYSRSIGAVGRQQGGHPSSPVTIPSSLGKEKMGESASMESRAFQVESASREGAGKGIGRSSRSTDVLSRYSTAHSYEDHHHHPEDPAKSSFPVSPHMLSGSYTAHSFLPSPMKGNNSHSILVQLQPLSHTPFLNFSSYHNDSDGNKALYQEKEGSQVGKSPANRKYHVKVTLTSERGLLLFTLHPPPPTDSLAQSGSSSLPLESSSHSPPPQADIVIPADFTVSIDLPSLWNELLTTLTEALQHLSMSQLVRIFPHKSKVFFFHCKQVKYHTTNKFREEILLDPHHSSRKVLGKYLWREWERMKRLRRCGRRPARLESVLTETPSSTTTTTLQDVSVCLVEEGKSNVAPYVIKAEEEDGMYFCLHYHTLQEAPHHQSLCLHSNRRNEDGRVRERQRAREERRGSLCQALFDYAYSDGEEEEEEDDDEEEQKVVPTNSEASTCTSTPADWERESWSKEEDVEEAKDSTRRDAPSASEMERIVSAAFCFLSHFTNSSLAAVSEAMRWSPHYHSSPLPWNRHMYLTLLQIGLLNDWLEESM